MMGAGFQCDVGGCPFDILSVFFRLFKRFYFGMIPAGGLCDTLSDYLPIPNNNAPDPWIGRNRGGRHFDSLYCTTHEFIVIHPSPKVRFKRNGILSAYPPLHASG
jgi:hypothetical protein